MMRLVQLFVEALYAVQCLLFEVLFFCYEKKCVNLCFSTRINMFAAKIEDVFCIIV